MLQHRFIVILVCVVLSGMGPLLAQSGFVAAGGDGSGVGGSVSISYGQVDFVMAAGSGGSMAEGIQQPVLLTLISDAGAICVGDTIELHSTATGGAWSSSDTMVATAGAGTGVITGAGAGVATISYEVAGSVATIAVTVNALPAVYPVTGGGGYCAGGAGIAIGVAGSGTGINYALYRSGVATGDTVSGTGDTISFGLQTLADTYTVVATRTGAGCMVQMSGSAAIAITVNPQAFNVTGGGCYDGYTAIAVGLDGSAAGTSYQLYHGGMPEGSPVAGTGTGISMGTFTASGIYTVFATDSITGCAGYMTDSAGIGPPPAIVDVTGGGGYCAGSAGVYVGVAGSAIGYCYQLYRDGVAVGGPVAGIGLAMSFGLQTVAGTYTVQAGYGGLFCTRAMVGSATVIVYSRPAAYGVTGGGTYCTGGTGVNISLTGSATSVSYRLYNSTTLMSTLPGTGSGLNFGLYTEAGIYTVEAMNAVTGCTTTMTGSATVVMNAIPVISGGVYTVASGAMITLTASVPGGTWASSAPAVANVGASTGVVAGVSLGNSIISYTAPAGCAGGKLVSVTATGFRESSQAEEISFEAQIVIVPNPSNGVFYIRGKEQDGKEEELKAELMNMRGEIVYTAKFKADAGVINKRIEPGEGISNGTYMLRLHSAAADKIFTIEIVH